MRGLTECRGGASLRTPFQKNLIRLLGLEGFAENFAAIFVKME